jgi:hypothetical protein
MFQECPQQKEGSYSKNKNVDTIIHKSNSLRQTLKNLQRKNYHGTTGMKKEMRHIIKVRSKRNKYDVFKMCFVQLYHTQKLLVAQYCFYSARHTR